MAKGKAGVGLSVSPDKEGEWVVSSVLPNGAAAQTGMIDPGDTIKACNGVVLKGYPRQAVIDSMTGPPATQAVMLVEKANSPNVITGAWTNRLGVSFELLGWGDGLSWEEESQGEMPRTQTQEHRS